MEILEIPKPKEKNKSHLKAELYTRLNNLGYDVYLDVVADTLFKYTKGIKGYQKTKFDLVIYVKDRAIMVVMVSPTNRRFTKSKFYGLPVIVLDHRKFDISKAQNKILEALLHG